MTCAVSTKKQPLHIALASGEIINDKVKEVPPNQPSSSSQKKKFQFNARQDIMLLREVIQIVMGLGHM